MLDNGEIKEIISEFFDNMGFEIEIVALDIRDNSISVKTKIEDPQILIGKNGQILNDIQHILSRLLKRKIQDVFYLTFDINDYKARKIDYLRDLANNLADEVSLIKKEKQLWPMSPQERRIIHLELAKRRDVVTESSGQEPERKIIIKPAS